MITRDAIGFGAAEQNRLSYREDAPVPPPDAEPPESPLEFRPV